MAERGEYCSVRVMLLDGPDFLALSKDARWVFMAAKMNVRGIGIAVRYRPEFIAGLAFRTGCTLVETEAAYTELLEADWIRHEQNVVWIVGHMKNDPHIVASDMKHRRGVMKRVAGLPRLDIVAEFIREHPDFFPHGEARSMGLEWAFANSETNGPTNGPNKGSRKTLQSNRTIPSTRPSKRTNTTNLASSNAAEVRASEEASGGREHPDVEQAITKGAPKLRRHLEDGDEELIAELFKKFETRTPVARAKLVAELAAALDGMHGPSRTWSELRTNVGDYLVNPHEHSPSLRRLRGYIYRDPKQPTTSGGGRREPVGPTAFNAALEGAGMVKP